MIEYKMLQKYCPIGIFVLPSYDKTSGKSLDVNSYSLAWRLFRKVRSLCRRHLQVYCRIPSALPKPKTEGEVYFPSVPPTGQPVRFRCESECGVQRLASGEALVRQCAPLYQKDVPPRVLVQPDRCGALRQECVADVQE